MSAPSGQPFAGVELGGTKCICVLAHGPGAVLDERRVPTTDPAETLAAIEAVLEEWRSGPGFAALGLACFGPLDLDRASPHYGFITATTKPGWRDTDAAGRLGRRFSVPVAIDTDVAGAAFAEGRWGGARGLETFAYITVGTGVGAGIIVDRQSVRGLGHAEAGHMRVPRLPGDSWPGSCVFHGDCVEGLASGFAIEQRTGRRGETIPAGDPVWPKVAHALAAMCHNLVTTCVPERILIGGSVAAGRPELLPMIRRLLVESLAGYGDAPRIAAAIETFIAAPELGDQAGPLGAIALAMG